MISQLRIKNILSGCPPKNRKNRIGGGTFFGASWMDQLVESAAAKKQHVRREFVDEES